MDELGRLREICFALPEVSERLSHGSPTFFVRDKKTLVSYHPHGIHGEHGMSLWSPAPPGVEEAYRLVAPKTLAAQLDQPVLDQPVLDQPTEDA